MAMIFLAVFLSVLMRSMQIGTYDQMIDGLVRYSTGYIQIHQNGYYEDATIDNSFEISSIDYQKLTNIDGITKVAPRINGFALSSFKNKSKPLSIIGLMPKLESQALELSEKLKSGHLIDSKSKSVLIGSDLADNLKIQVGDSLVLLGQGYHAQTAAGLYKVEGILNFANPELNSNTLFMPLTLAQTFFGAEGRVTSIAINTHPNYSLSKAKNAVLIQIDSSKFEVLDWKELLPELHQSIQGDQAGGTIIILILYMVIAFGILGTILMLTAEREFEYGVLVAIGMKRFKLGIMLLFETIIMTVLGAAIAILAASPILYYFYYNPITFSGKAADSMKEMGFEPAMYTSIDFGIALNQTITIVIISVLLCIYPIIKLQFLKPVEAMRS